MKLRIRKMKSRGSAVTGPLPSVAAGIGPFQVNEGSLPPGIGGMVGTTVDKKRVYHTPRDNSPASIAIRAHEYGHLATNRLGLPEDLGAKFREAGVIDGWNQTIQDMLANAYMMRNGSDSIQNLPLESDFPVDAKRPEEWYGLASYYLRSRYLTACQSKRNEVFDALSLVSIDGVLTKPLEDAIRVVDLIVIYDEWKDYQQLIDLGVRLQTVYGPWPVVKPGLPGDKPGEGSGNKLRAPSHVPWGSMRIVQCDLKAQRALRRNMKSLRRAYVGAFKHPLQALAPAFDGKAFSLSRRVAGGTVLVDLSGSMDIESSQLVDLLAAAPGAVVAGYSSERKTLQSGVLGILAANGKSVNERPEQFGTGNVVDGPALDWLGRQPEPRIWVCDGVVTGVDDNLSPYLTSEAYRKVSAYHVTRVNNIAEAKALLKTKQNGKPGLKTGLRLISVLKKGGV